MLRSCCKFYLKKSSYSHILFIKTKCMVIMLLKPSIFVKFMALKICWGFQAAPMQPFSESIFNLKNFPIPLSHTFQKKIKIKKTKVNVYDIPKVFYLNSAIHDPPCRRSWGPLCGSIMTIYMQRKCIKFIISTEGGDNLESVSFLGEGGCSLERVAKIVFASRDVICRWYVQCENFNKY